MRDRRSDVRRMGTGQVSGLRGAVAFLTRVPVGRTSTGVDIARSVPFVPIVGSLVGLAVAGIYVGIGVPLPRLPAAALAVTVGIALTGALHEDGLADTADALGARDRVDALRILRDPTHGTYGVLALVASFALRVSAVASFSRATALTMLPVAHALSRTAAIAVVAAGPPLAADGLGAAYRSGIRGRPLAVCIGVAAVVAAALLQLWALTAVAVTVVLGVAVRSLLVRRLGGANGDVAGACQQVLEVALLLLASGRSLSL
jgi:adenosylcobinamide-GDP ribazoletransferase